MGSRAEVSRLKINNNQGKVPEMESTFANTTNHKGLVKAAILDLNVGYFNQDQSMYYDKSTKLEEYEPGASRSEVISALKKMAKAPKISRKHD